MSSANGYSYTQRSAARAQWDSVYEKFLSNLQLDPGDRAQLRARGLTDRQIDESGYRTKPRNNDTTLLRAIEMVERSGSSLEGVPGFNLNEKTGKRTCIGAFGILIPSRDISGSMNSLLVRRDENDTHRGKYVAFSSPKKPEGASARNTTHCPVTHSFPSRKEMGTTLRITEGLLKADVASALDKTIYTLGIPGLNAPEDLRSILQELEISRILLAFDMESTTDVQFKSAKLCQELSKDYDVTFEEWNPEHKGIDDALLKDPASIHRLSPDELAERIKHNTQRDPDSGEYVYVVSVERFFHKEDLHELTHSQFSSTHGMNGASDVNDLLSNDHHPFFPRCDLVEFYPGRPTIFKDGRFDKLNLWRPSLVEPAQGDVTVFLEHMIHLVPQEFERQQLLNWMAYQVQFPGEKIHWAAFLQGKPGIGKSFLGHVMAALLGEHNVARPTNTELHEVFTSWEKRCQLVVVEEVMAQGRQELMNKLKPKITEPITSIREMHKNSYKQPNRYNMLLLTNHEDAIIIDDNDRRYLVIFSPAEPQIPEYNKRLFNWLKQEASQSALLHWAQHFDLQDFEPKAHAPKTKARKKLIINSRSRLEDYVLSRMEERTWPFSIDVISINDIRASKECPKDLAGMHPNKWADIMKRGGAMPLKDGAQIDVPGVGRRRLWALRRPEIWSHKDVKTERIVEEYLRWSSHNQPGGNPLDDIAPLSA